MDKQAVENGSQREIVREGHRIQENNLEHLRAPENVVEVLTDATGCPSASCCVSEEPKEQMQHPSTSKNSSMNFTISVVCISLFLAFFLFVFHPISYLFEIRVSGG